jgi:hypothetical protein
LFDAAAWPEVDMPYRCRKKVITFTIITNELAQAAQAARAEMLARAERAEILSVASVSLPA